MHDAHPLPSRPQSGRPQSGRTQSGRTRSKRSGYQWFPWIFTGVMTVVVLVNVCMAWLAHTSSTGLVTMHAYQEGTHYNDVLAAAAEQDALGWKSHASVDNNVLTVHLSDRDGHPLDGLVVRAWVTSPVTPDPDTSPIPLTAGPDHGYITPLTVPHPGQWEVHVHAKLGHESYYAAERIFIH